MIKFVTPLVTSLTLVAALAAGPAGAAPKARTYENPHKNVLRTVVRAGFNVQFDKGECLKNPNLFGYVAPGPKIFMICLRNARFAGQAYRTIRHEALHVAQYCNGWRPLKPDLSDYFISRAQDNGWHILGYPEHQWRVEAEARVLADWYSAQEVTRTLRKYCF
ncbi:hypothetical protein P60_gp06 [Synechococcus phage P60]|uniref:Uncharacterized protein n=1 Tax=Synechococcus phage P60 TaxID=2905923 RepID=L0CQL4_9CAUD|nr:hypothetical protein P60_gp06 [Synechococcus phage P60]AGA17875.1 hypothetical protein P60_gp06 [Synechococcus phage P60]